MGKRVVVVGAGISGLAAAFALRRGAPPGTQVLVVDGASRPGGKLRVSPVAGIDVDEGAEAMLVRVPEGVELATEAGLADRLTHAATTAAAVVVGGSPHALPARTVMGVPGDVDTLRASGVVSDDVLARVAAEPHQSAVRLGEGEDVAVGELVGSRFGRQVVERLVDPLLGGVYAGRADNLSLRATVPALARALTEAPPDTPPDVPSAIPSGHGSLLRAAGSAVSAAPTPAGPVFATLRGGLGSLPAAVVAAAGLDVRLDLPVRRITRTDGGFRLEAGPVPRPTHLDADAVVVAVPAPKAAGMLAEVVPWAAAELRGVEYASVAIVTLAYPASAAAALPQRSGLLVPDGEGCTVKAVTFSSRKWAHLSDSEHVVLRGSVGRYGDERALHRDDGELADLVAADVARLAGITERPVEARVTRWGGGLPQYAPGHLDRVRRIRAAVAAVPGLAVCGAVYDGVGVPACIRTGAQAAAQVLTHLTAGGQSSHD